MLKLNQLVEEGEHSEVRKVLKFLEYVLYEENYANAPFLQVSLISGMEHGLCGMFYVPFH